MSSGVKIKVITGFGISVALILGAGLLTLGSFARFRSAVNSVSQPDLRLEKMRELQFEISESESGVRAYALSKEEQYLDPYYRLLSVYSDQMDSIRALTGTSKARQKEIAVFDSLLNEKLLLFFDFLDLKRNEKIKVKLGDIVRQIKDSPAPLAVKDPKSDTKPKGFVDRVKGFFGKPKDPPGDPDSLKPKRYLDAKNRQVQDILTRAEAANKMQVAYFSERELALLRRDDSIMTRIRFFVNAIEREDRLESGFRLKEARTEVESASETLMMMGILAIILLIALTYFIFADLSRSNQYRMQLEDSKKNAEKLARIKEEFLANMSHEIRTPLNSIIGFSDLALQSRLDPETRKYLEGVQTSSEHLLNVVNDILDFSKIEAGKMKIEQTGFRPSAIIREVVDTLKPEAVKRGIGLDYTIPEGISNLVLIGDPFRIKQILLNFVSNGIKFTEKGKVSISMHAPETDKDHVLLQLDVADTGIGIPPEKKEEIFGEFSQADTSITRKYGGTGLGLAISKRLAGLMGGTLEVNSEPGKGSVFSFHLPSRKGTAGDVRKKKTPAPAENLASLERKKVLIADDDAMNRLLLKTILSRHNLETTEATNGKEAFDLFRKSSYDLILADIQMPELSGIGMVQQIRAMPDARKSKTPVIALTANVVREDIKKYMDAGMDDYVLKPFKEDVLWDHISRALKLEPGETKSESTPSGKNNTTGKSSYSLAELRKVANGDNQFIHTMLGSFVQQMNENLRKGREGLENRNWEQVGQVVHKMRPSCHNLGLYEIYEMLKKIETLTRHDKDFGPVAGLFSEMEKQLKPVLAEISSDLAQGKV